MAKAYHQNHQAKKLEVNFNHKQWRQDFAYFVKNSLLWVGDTRVTRTRSISKSANIYHKGIKSFEVQNTSGDSVYVEFKNNSEILGTTFPNLAEDYLKTREL